MAAAPENQQVHFIQKEFEDQLACPICLGLFTVPKTLPCQHIYCEGCLVHLARSNRGCIRCPECRKDHPGKAGDYPTNFKISGLCDYLRRLDIVGEAADTSTCKKHMNSELNKICCTCTEPVCEKCVLTTHRGHRCLETAEFLNQRQRQLQDIINSVKGRYQDLKHAKERAARIHMDMSNNYARTLRELHERAQAIKDAVEQSERNLADRLKSDFARKEKNLNHQIQEFEKQMEEMTCFLQRKEEFQATQQLPTVAMAIHEVWDQYKSIAEREAKMAPCEDSSVVVEWNQRVLEGLCLQMTLGKVIGRPTAVPNESYIDAPPTVKVGKEVEIRLQLRDHMGSDAQNDAADVTAFVYAPNKMCVQIDLQCTPQGPFKAKFTPKYIGKYQIVVKLAGDTVKNCPFSLLVKPKYEYKMLLTTMPSMNNPHDIKEVEGGFLIADKSNHCVIKVNEKFKIQFKLPDPPERSKKFDPFAIAVTNDHIYVSDLANNRVVVYNRNENFVMEVGDDHLKKPTGLAVDSRGFLYVADDDYGSIEVFSTQGQFIKSISQQGTGPNDLKHPWHMAFNKREHLLICDSHNNRIQIFQPDQGVVIRSISTNVENRIMHPRGLALDQNDNIFVTVVEPGLLMAVHCVLVFTQDGDFLGKFGGAAHFNYPRGLIVSEGDEASVLVVDGAKHCIKEFS